MVSNTHNTASAAADFLEISDDLFWETDKFGVISRALNWEPYFKQTIVGKNLLELLCVRPDSARDWEQFEENWQEKTGCQKLRVHLKTEHGELPVECSFKVVGYGTEKEKIVGLFRDIAEQISIERKLKYSEDRFDSLVASSPSLISITDLSNSRYVDVNESFCQFHRRNRARFIGQKSLAVSTVHETAVYQDIVQRLLLGEEISQKELTITRGDGAIRKISSIPVLLEYEDGPKLLVFSTDITDQLELERSARLTDAILKTMKQGITLFSEDMHLVFCNEYFKELLDFPEELCKPGTPVADMARLQAERGMYGPGDVEELVKEKLAFMNREFAHKYERKQGEGRILEIEGTPIPGVGLLSIYKDITERVEAEAHVRESEKMLREVLETLPFSYTLWDSEGQRILGNDLMYQWFKDEIPNYKEIMHSLSEIIRAVLDKDLVKPRPADKEKYIQEQLELVKNPPANKLNIRHIGEKWMQVINKKLPSGHCASIRMDITEQHHQEEQLRQAQKMEAVGQLTGGIAHDFNNILSIILGNLEILEELDLFEGDLAASRFEAIQRAGERGAELTQQLLSFSRKQELRPNILNMNSAIREMNMLLKSTLGGSIDLEIELADELWDSFIDQGQLENSLINLSINARDAMKGNGTFSLQTANVKLKDRVFDYDNTQVSGDFVRLTISDTGIGISPDNLKQIFEPFFTTKEVGKGSGLGLSMVFGFVRQSGGYIQVSSDLGAGTMFEVFFPRV
ncbi:PAS-domain containing protein [Sneathiella limimaris]|uniref:PAS-domain containing protein n=1 Tax=Sneathiella limimaris TaxID=1964213 RepID=UPI00146EA89E|nr:PAS-domain containing protein [Sneathiella limimaris]